MRGPARLGPGLLVRMGFAAFAEPRAPAAKGRDDAVNLSSRARAVLSGVVALSGAVRGAGQTAGPPLGISWRPGQPVQGALVTLAVRPESLAVSVDSTATVQGVAAGETLHFEFASRRHVFWALAAVPLDARDSLVVQLLTQWNGSSQDTLIALPVAGLALDTERLQVALEFVRPPDSVLAARLAAERELVHTTLLRAQDTPRLWRERFVRPVRGRVTGAFGLWREFNGTLVDRHTGLDLAGTIGTRVHATNRGVVVLVTEQYYAGLTVVLDHGGGLVTSYSHLSRASVALGDTVRRGETIGRVGGAGRVTGPHLHWAAYYETLAVDPIDLLSLEPPW